MDFGNENKAQKMFTIKQESCSSKLKIPSYNDTVASACSGMVGNYTVYSFIKKFYIELQISGMQDQSEALQTASLFLDLYASKIE